jgi:hypothetical protein
MNVPPESDTVEALAQELRKLLAKHRTKPNGLPDASFKAEDEGWLAVAKRVLERERDAHLHYPCECADVHRLEVCPTCERGHHVLDHHETCHRCKRIAEIGRALGATHD